MRVFLTTLALGFASIVGYDIWKDPANLYHSLPVHLSRNLGSDQCWESFEGLDTVELRLSQHRLIERPDLVFLGSSRGLQAPGDDSLLKPSVRFFNSSTFRAMSQDYAISWQSLKSNSKLPKYLVIFVDPWVFNTHSDLEGWFEHQDLLKQFLTETSDDKNRIQAVRLLANVWEFSIRRHWSRFTDLFAWETLKASFQADSGARPKVALGPLSIADPKVLISACWQPDGRYLYPTRVQGRPEDEIVKLSKHYADGAIWQLDQWQIDEDAKKIIERLLADAQKEKTEVLLISLPYHPIVAQAFRDRPEYAALLKDYRHLLSDLKPARYCDAFDPIAEHCAESEFMDPVHARPSCIAKIVRRCFAQVGWGQLLWSGGADSTTKKNDP